MKRTAVAFTSALLLLTFAACGGGGGGGNQQAFCNDLQDLSDQVGRGALDRPDDVREVVNSLLESAPDDNLQDVRDVEKALNDRKTGDDLHDAIVDAFRGSADDCQIDQFADAPATTATTATTEPPTTEPTTDTTEGTTDTTTAGTPTNAADVLIGSRTEVPAEITDAQEVADAQSCFDGDAAACDNLFLETDFDSVGETYGKTCAGRITAEEGDAFDCDELLLPASEPSADIVDQANAQACHDGNMVACDDLFRGATENTEDQRYGALCGDRVARTQVFCNTIFGDQTSF
jgi:hypothetical protein